MQELLFGIIGGTALLMYGVDTMGDGLEKVSGETMKKIITVLTGNVVSAFFVGILVTAIVQSSTAVTVLTVGFVNSGLMKISQAVGIIYGANIGTTITAQLMAFSFKFKLTDIALPVLGIGFGISNMVKNKKIKNIGQALMGFGMMFLGLKILNGGIPYMQESAFLRSFFTNYASIPVVGVLLGIIVTAMVHSSAATVALVMILSQAGLIDLQAAITIMLGDNIGTCFTAQLASMTGNINARRTAWAHTLYNVIGVILTWIFLPQFVKLVTYATDYLHANADISVYIANSHTLFNSVNALIFLPMTKVYVGFLNKVIKSKVESKNGKVLLNRLLLDTPVAALEASRNELIRGTEILSNMVKDVMNMIYREDTKKMGEIADNEFIINEMQKDLTRYIVEISKRELTERQSIMVPAIISSINNIERSGDRVIEIASLASKKIDGGLPFTDTAVDELKQLEGAIMELFDLTILTLRKKDDKSIERITELENLVDALSELFQNNHLDRLNCDVCNVDSGVIYIDIIGHLERIADHIYKIAMYTKDELFGERRKYN
ncbi:MAG: Na/Pi cotransporter family protein [Tissierellaceae bacterium]